MKVQLSIIEWPNYYWAKKINEDGRLSESIAKKLGETFFDLPFMPTKEMKIDPYSFAAKLNLNEDEHSFFTDNGSWYIDDLYIHLDYLEVSLTCDETGRN